MKVLAIFLSAVILQASASFFDEFRGAVSSVESSFGKLLSDVITDVKETIDCTLLAVENVLSLGVFGDSSEYEKRCKGVEESPTQVETRVEPPPPPPDTSQHGDDEQHDNSSNKENTPADKSIVEVDKVLCDTINKDDPHDQLETIKKALKNETERLTDISDLLKNQLDSVSSEIKEKLAPISLKPSEPSIESIWQDIKTLREVEHNHKHTPEAKKISHILDEILSMLDEKEVECTDSDDYKIEEIMRKLKKQSNVPDSKEEQYEPKHNDFPKDFRDYANKIIEESKASNAAPVPEQEQVKSEENKEIIEITTTATPKSRRKKTTTTTTTTEKPLSVAELESEFGSLFDFAPSNPESESNKKAIESAKSIIEDTKINDMVINSYLSSANKDAKNLFDDPELLDF